ncbi:MAG: extracellular solute-binding protein, partial [Chloroflexota bacterium]
MNARYVLDVAHVAHDRAAPCQATVGAGWTRRRMAQTAAVGLAMPVAAACGGPQAEAPVPSGKLPSAKVRYLHWDRPRDEVYARVWQEFSQQHPGVQVELNTITGAYTEKLLTMLVSGDAPDIFALDRSQLEPFVQ